MDRYGSTAPVRGRGPVGGGRRPKSDARPAPPISEKLPVPYITVRQG
jgi:hypothetical protein